MKWCPCGKYCISPGPIGPVAQRGEAGRTTGGGGGGFLQSGFKEQRLAYGKLKDEQIKATGADDCIAGCHNCHAQIHELSEHYGGGYPVVHLWTLICLSLGVLGPNERTYLGDDLRDVNVFHPETGK